MSYDKFHNHPVATLIFNMLHYTVKMLEQCIIKTQVNPQKNNINHLIGGFLSIMVYPSYLYVSLGLFDSLASLFKRGKNTVDRLTTAVRC